MNKFYFRKKGFPPLGIVIYKSADRYHLFTVIRNPGGNKSKGGKNDVVIMHQVSDNLLEWEELPTALEATEEDGGFESYTLYDLQVFENEGKYYLFYTGLDTPSAPGQKQAIGLAVSDDLINWTRVSKEPVLECDPEYYEQQVPECATYQDKDRLRMWFRDPWVIKNPVTGKFGMAVAARTREGDPDLRGCFSWAESDDLINWQSHPPCFAPERFHTIECPVIFEQNGFWYCIYLTHQGWGTPLTVTDPYTIGGGFYTVSDTGPAGPYRQPKDEVLPSGKFIDWSGNVTMRTMVFRTFEGPDNKKYISYHFRTYPAPDDKATVAEEQELMDEGTVMPLVKPLNFSDDGEMWVEFSPLINDYLKPVQINFPAAGNTYPETAGWRQQQEKITGKDFREVTVNKIADTSRNIVVTADIRITKGLRAGFVIRGSLAEKSGITVTIDRQLKCVSVGLLDGTVIDRRKFELNEESCELKVLAHGPGIEIYCNNKLMLHQARYKENGTEVALLADKSEAEFSNIEIYDIDLQKQTINSS
ncbi:MAG: glycoside hydrolase family protein [Planctomycetota bacterium]|jgi:beta-fructofuranosidase